MSRGNDWRMLDRCFIWKYILFWHLLSDVGNEPRPCAAIIFRTASSDFPSRATHLATDSSAGTYVDQTSFTKLFHPASSNTAATRKEYIMNDYSYLPSSTIIFEPEENAFWMLSSASSWMAGQTRCSSFLRSSGFPKTLAPSFLRSMKLLSSHRTSRPK